MKPDIILRTKNIHKSFFGISVLKNISFDLYKGEVLSLVGENGAGKSTLLKIISGIHNFGSYTGEITGENEETLKFNSVKDANDFGISMIYQEISVEYDLTVAENILLGNWRKKKTGLIDWKKINEDARNILNRLNFNIEVNKKVRTLSASQQQIICIARALMKNPKILILDEPTASLTENETKVLFDIILNLKKEGISCLYISHRLSEVINISNRIIVLRDGFIIATYEKTCFQKNKIISDMIGKNLNLHKGENIEVDVTYPVLEVKKLSLASSTNKKNLVINNISFDLHKGEILGIAGTLGSGRSEILRSIYGAYPKITGTIVKNGKSLNIKNPRDAIVNGIGFLTEERKKDGYVGTMSIKNNASLNILDSLKMWEMFLSSSLEQNIVNEYLQRFKYKGPTYDKSIHALSGGNQQKVIFAKILMAESDVLLLDEPTRGIDVGAKDEIYHIIEKLRLKGVSFIIVSSELPEIVRLCTRVLILHNKKINAELTSSELSEHKILHLTSFKA